jgi:signal transduction histidine kinase
LKRIIAIISLLCCLLHQLAAQTPVAVNGIVSYQPLYGQMLFHETSGAETPQAVAAAWKQWTFVPLRDSMITRHNFLQGFHFQFMVVNKSTAVDSILFFPGMVTEADLLDFETGALVTNNFTHYTEVTGQPVHMPMLVLQPDEERRLIVRPRFRYYNYADWRPSLVRPHHVTEMLYQYRIKPEISYIFGTFFFLGILATMLVYAIIRFLSTRRREFLFYAATTLCFMLYFGYQLMSLFNLSHGYHRLDLFLKQFLQIGGHVFYMLFVTYFLDLRRTIPVLFRQTQILYIPLVIYLLVVVFTAFDDRYYVLNMKLFNWIRIGLLIYSIFAVYILFRSKAPLAKYVAAGVTGVSVLAGVAFYYSNVPIGFTAPFFAAVGGPIFFFKLGILVEQVCFILGLTRKTQTEDARRIMAVESLRIENEKKEFEKFMAVLETRDKERTRIAQEIHDDIGSGLTSIRLLSEIARARPENAESKEIEKISASANELIENMNQIIWSFNSKNDTLPNLVAYVRRYVVTYFEATAIDVKINIPPAIPPVQISGDFRRSVFLVVKESIHNILKHAQASRVEIEVAVQPQFTITIKDNGKGFGEEEVKLFSNGLRSMRERMESIGGSFTINGGGGTTVTLTMPV